MCIILSDWDSSHAPSVDHQQGMQMSCNGKAALHIFIPELGLSPRADFVIIKNAQLLVLPLQSTQVLSSCAIQCRVNTVSKWEGIKIITCFTGFLEAILSTLKPHCENIWSANTFLPWPPHHLPVHGLPPSTACSLQKRFVWLQYN